MLVTIGIMIGCVTLSIPVIYLVLRGEARKARIEAERLDPPRSSP